MTDWNPRDIDLDFSFLGDGQYEAVIFTDGVNADKQAEDYKKEVTTVNASQSKKLHLAPGGGFAITLHKK